jgi:hypothetical protein
MTVPFSAVDKGTRAAGDATACYLKKREAPAASISARLNVNHQSFGSPGITAHDRLWVTLEKEHTHSKTHFVDLETIWIDRWAIWKSGYPCTVSALQPTTLLK